MVALGLISYPLSLWHWPLLSFAATEGVDTAWVKMAIVAASVLLAWLTTSYIEYPIRFGRLRSRGGTYRSGYTVGRLARCGVDLLLRWTFRAISAGHQARARHDEVQIQGTGSSRHMLDCGRRRV
jgi:peptidoglycan/LPS O-acetylase OafA/YrhL